MPLSTRRFSSVCTFFSWQIERGAKNFPEVKGSMEIERREFDDYNAEKEP